MKKVFKMYFCDVLRGNKIFIIFKHSYLNIVQYNVLNFLNFLANFLRYIKIVLYGSCLFVLVKWSR